MFFLFVVGNIVQLLRPRNVCAPGRVHVQVYSLQYPHEVGHIQHFFTGGYGMVFLESAAQFR